MAKLKSPVNDCMLRLPLPNQTTRWSQAYACEKCASCPGGNVSILLSRGESEGVEALTVDCWSVRLLNGRGNCRTDDQALLMCKSVDTDAER